MSNFKNAVPHLGHPWNNMEDLYGLSPGSSPNLIQDVPNNAAVGSAIVAVGRLSKGAGKLPFLSLDAPLDRCATKDVIGAATGANGNRALGGGNWPGRACAFRCQVEWIAKCTATHALGSPLCWAPNLTSPNVIQKLQMRTPALHCGLR